MKPTGVFSTAIGFILCLCTLAPLLSVAQTGDQVWGYKVKPGDRIIDIAKAYQKSPEEWKKIQQKNAISDPKLLLPGTQLNIPVKDLKQGDPTAEAVLVHGDVQRLDTAGQPLAKLSSGDVLKMGDTVQTGARSTLTIRFADDSRMLVTEKSKVNLASLVNYGKTGMADTKVRVLEGGTDSKVSPQKGSVARYEINTPAINLAVRGTGFRVQVDGASGSTRTEVVEGLVAGNSGDSQANLAGGFGIIAEPGKPLGQPRKLLAAPQLVSGPKVVNRLPALFAWLTLQGAQKYRLQLLASVQGNEAIIVDEQLDNTSVQWDSLPDGDYVLRVRGVDPTGLEGTDATRSFQVITRPEPPVLTFPSNGYLSDNSKLSFQWDAATEADKYTFQLAEDANFERIVAVVPQIPKSTKGVLLTLPRGQYFWRVASINIAGKVGPFSDAFGFSQRGAETPSN
jgi:hypothetical protein